MFAPAKSKAAIGCLLLTAFSACTTPIPQDYTTLDRLLNSEGQTVSASTVIPEATAPEVSAAEQASVMARLPETASKATENPPLSNLAASGVTATIAPAEKLSVGAIIVERSHVQEATPPEDEVELVPRALFKSGETTAMLVSAAIGKPWTFDAYGDDRHQLKAEKGKQYVTASLSIHAPDNNPQLFGVGLYAGNRHSLKLLGLFEYRFAHWLDQGTYLGNYPDGMNDFSATHDVLFSLGLQINASEGLLPLYLVITQEGCHERHHSPHTQPTVRYLPTTCPALKRTLSARDFRSGKLAVLKQLK